MSDAGAEALLELRGLSKRYGSGTAKGCARAGTLVAVDGVDLRIHPQQSVGLAGESGCGKTTLARAIMLLTPATQGQILFAKADITRLRGAARQRYRRDAQMVFQNPHGSLDPRMTVCEALAEPLRVHTELRSEKLTAQARVLLADVGLTAALLHRYPHELSGGQAQRVAIARALASQPRLLILDEPTSALDVSAQARVLNLLQALRQRHRLTYLCISHDLGVLRHLCDRLVVMRHGRIVEQGATETIFDGGAQHSYTRALLAAVPTLAYSHLRGARTMRPRHASGNKRRAGGTNNAVRQA